MSILEMIQQTQSYLRALKKSPVKRQDMLGALNYLMSVPGNLKDKIHDDSVKSAAELLEEELNQLKKILIELFYGYKSFIEIRLNKLLKPLPYIKETEHSSINIAIQFYIDLFQIMKNINFSKLDDSLKQKCKEIFNLEALNPLTKIRFSILFEAYKNIKQSYNINDLFKINLISQEISFLLINNEIEQAKILKNKNYGATLNLIFFKIPAEDLEQMTFQESLFLNKKEFVEYALNLLDFIYQLKEEPETREIANRLQKLFLEFIIKNQSASQVKELNKSVFGFLLSPNPDHDLINHYLRKAYSILQKNETSSSMHHIHQTVIERIKNIGMDNHDKEVYLTKLARIYILYTLIANEPAVTRKKINSFWKSLQKENLANQNNSHIMISSPQKISVGFPQHLFQPIENILNAKNLEEINQAFKELDSSIEPEESSNIILEEDNPMPLNQNNHLKKTPTPIKEAIETCMLIFQPADLRAGLENTLENR